MFSWGLMLRGAINDLSTPASDADGCLAPSGGDSAGDALLALSGPCSLGDMGQDKRAGLRSQALHMRPYGSNSTCLTPDQSLSSGAVQRAIQSGCLELQPVRGRKVWRRPLGQQQSSEDGLRTEKPVRANSSPSHRKSLVIKGQSGMAELPDGLKEAKDVGVCPKLGQPVYQDYQLARPSPDSGGVRSSGLF
mmetsp:Transcript_41640/g.64976  ORF Transcript_41640/g.64976 Transcript_41640/m.64976 type:complete len:192 (-) Transcript_41640:181-756(-)